MAKQPMSYYRRLVERLAMLSAETETVEFKLSSPNIDKIAKDISALSNSAALHGKKIAYRIWGIDDATHEIVGTEFDFEKLKKGNLELVAWLTNCIDQDIGFEFTNVKMSDGRKVVVLEIPAAEREPTTFKNNAFIRIGSNTTRLAGHPKLGARLWASFDRDPKELRIIEFDKSPEEVASLLDFSSYYKALGYPVPTSLNRVLADLENNKFIVHNDADYWDITTIGALMLANDLRDFSGLEYRTVWLTRYDSPDRTQGGQDMEFTCGYARSFEEIVRFTMAFVPRREKLVDGKRVDEIAFPEVAIRELIANMMVHQDLEASGSSPKIEVFADKIEFTNLGKPLVPISRIVDMALLQRNEATSRFFHRCGFCEERGSGYDKIIKATSASNLLAPRIEVQQDKLTHVTMLAKVPFKSITKEDRIWTCYMYACLRHLNNESITNKDVRELFAIPDKNRSTATEILRSAVDAGRIKLLNPEAGSKARRYVPVED